MISKTRGIVIKYLKYGDSSIITQIFTEKFGLTSFLVNGIRSPRSKRSIGYFQPFSLLDLVCYFKSNREIQRLSEYKFYQPTHNLQQDIRKATIVLFLTELLSKLLAHEQDEEHKPLFGFLSDSVITMDQLKTGIENFHLHFLLKIMPYMGIGIADGEELIRSMELENIEDDSKLMNFISKLIQSPMDEVIPSSGNLRYRTLELLLNYFQHHIMEFGQIKSLKVLHQVFAQDLNY